MFNLDNISKDKAVELMTDSKFIEYLITEGIAKKDLQEEQKELDQWFRLNITEWHKGACKPKITAIMGARLNRIMNK